MSDKRFTAEDRRYVIPKPLSHYPEFERGVPAHVARYLSARPYQLPAIAEMVQRMSGPERARIILGAPTGAGKGKILAYLCESLVRLGIARRILIVTPRREISQQLQENLNKIQVGLAGKLGDQSGAHAPIQVSTIETVLRRAARNALPPYDVLLLDEVHHFVGNTWAEVTALNPNAHAVGFTATTERADGRALGEIFNTLIVPINYEELRQRGFIVRCDVYSPQHYLEGDLARSPLDAYMLFGRQRGPTIVFERSKIAAQCSLDAFRGRGIQCELITEETPRKKRDTILKDFKAGRIPVVINVLVLTEGVDAERATVAIVALSCNNTRWRQVTGRVLRATEGKKRALVIDLAGNYHACSNGNPTWDYAYSLDRDSEIKHWREGGGEGFEREPKDHFPEILNCDLYDHSSQPEPIIVDAVASPNMASEQEVYMFKLKEDVRSGRMTPQIAKRFFEARFGRQGTAIDFR